MKRLPLLLLLAALAGCSVFPFPFVPVDPTPQPPPIETSEGNCSGPDCPETASPTMTVFLPVGETATPDVTLTPEITTTPTETVLPTSTAAPTQTHTPSPTALPFAIQPGTPVYIQNFAHPQQGCNWMGVAGQVFDRSGNPMANTVVVVEGVLNATRIDALGMTGSQSAYGPGGYEVVFGNSPLDSTDGLTITLYGLAGETLSAPFRFSTYADCSKNLILINFTQVLN